jgi:hypothetical protein
METVINTARQTLQYRAGGRSNLGRPRNKWVEEDYWC